MDAGQIAQNIASIRQRVRLAAVKCQREPEELTILAVSKTRPAAEIESAYQCGLDQFGENYLQEALVKIDQLQHLPLTWHFIGPIQSNKTRAIAAHFDWVHSVDRLKIARRLSEQRPSHLPDLQLCLQVNVSAEDSKAGVSMGELSQLALAVAALPRMCLRGLMAIPAATSDEALQRRAFAELHSALLALRRDFAAKGLDAGTLDTLSMGMSGDLEAAIAEGSTLLRLGTALFGPRPAR
jgi:pyridoxal phosphate enzyme (YggS family)